MMKAKKVKKRILLLLVFSVLFITNRITAYASACDGYWTYNVQEALEADLARYEEYDKIIAQCTQNKSRDVKCRITSKQSQESTDSSVDAYDKDGNYIGSLANNSNTFLAGTFIGIDAYEIYKKKFQVTFDATCTERELHYVWQCVQYCDCDSNGDGRRDCDKEDYVPECRSRPCEPTPGECYGMVSSYLDTLAHQVKPQPSGGAVRQTVNDITNPEKITVPADSQKIDYGCINMNGWSASQTVTAEFTYNLGAAWIDPVTGTVKYEGNGAGSERIQASDKETYIKVPNNLARGGLYFIPLNAKSTDAYSYSFGGGIYGAGLCQKMIEDYDSGKDEYWYDFLVDKDGKQLPKSKTAALAKVEKGCQLSYRGNINIIQKFYNEEKSGKTSHLEGYNFYYRPIDYSEPFPNGIPSDSYWNKLYNENTNAITVKNANGHYMDLDNSFQKVTYSTANNYSLNAIREYNRIPDNLYTSWLGMTISGSSSFIVEGSSITRKNCETYYALGCGPSNSNWQECKNRKTEVCKQ